MKRRRLLLALALFVLPLALLCAQTPARTALTLPGTLPWSSSVTYHVADVATSGGATYLSLVAGNVNHTPASSPSQWALISAGGVVSFNSRTGTIALTAADVNAVGAITNPVTLTAAEVNAVGAITNDTSGNSGTATALASAPTKCSAGNAPIGVDAGGNAQGCAPIATPPITGTLVESGFTNVSNGCTAFSVTMSASVPSGHTVIVGPAVGSNVTGLNQPPTIYSISGASVGVAFCNAWAGSVSVAAATFDLAVI